MIEILADSREYLDPIVVTASVPLGAQRVWYCLRPTGGVLTQYETTWSGSSSTETTRTIDGVPTTAYRRSFTIMVGPPDLDGIAAPSIGVLPEGEYAASGRVQDIAEIPRRPVYTLHIRAA